MIPPPPLHLGSLHPYEQALVMLVAFGPFLVLGVVVAVLRRRAVAEEQAEAARAGLVRPSAAREAEGDGTTGPR